MCAFGNVIVRRVYDIRDFRYMIFLHFTLSELEMSFYTCFYILHWKNDFLSHTSDMRALRNVLVYFMLLTLVIC